MAQRQKPDTKRVAVGGKSDELYLISKFRELSPARREDLLLLIDVLASPRPRRTSQRTLKLVKLKR